MALASGSHKLGPDNGKLWVRTKKAGAAAMAGHNLLIEVTAWEATLDVGDDGAPARIELSADSRSMKVIEATGGVAKLDDDDKAGIAQTIDDEVLRGATIAFSSTEIGCDGRVQGDLELAGQRHPIAFELAGGDDGRLSAGVTIKQSDWGIKPYSALFGTLKVIDEVTVEVSAELPQAGH
jgi:polyisoprenoid-binding protein YceI